VGRPDAGIPCRRNRLSDDIGMRSPMVVNTLVSGASIGFIPGRGTGVRKPLCPRGHRGFESHPLRQERVRRPSQDSRIPDPSPPPTVGLTAIGAEERPRAAG